MLEHEHFDEISADVLFKIICWQARSAFYPNCIEGLPHFLLSHRIGTNRGLYLGGCLPVDLFVPDSPSVIWLVPENEGFLKGSWEPINEEYLTSILQGRKKMETSKHTERNYSAALGSFFGIGTTTFILRVIRGDHGIPKNTKTICSITLLSKVGTGANWGERIPVLSGSAFMK